MLDERVLNDRSIPGAKDPNDIMTVTDRLVIEATLDSFVCGFLPGL
jgi:hypothetical protein